MFVIWRKIAEDKTLGIAENIWADRYTNCKVPGSEDVAYTWNVQYSFDITDWSLSSGCHAEGSENVSC